MPPIFGNTHIKFRWQTLVANVILCRSSWFFSSPQQGRIWYVLICNKGPPQCMGPQSHHDTSFRISEQFFSYPSKCEHRQVGDMLWSIPVSFPISPRLLHTMSWAFMYALSAGAMEQSLRVNADVFPVSLCKPVETRSVESWMFHDWTDVREENRMNGWNRNKQLEKKHHFRPNSKSPKHGNQFWGLI